MLVHRGDALEVLEARVEVVDVVVERGVVHEDVDRAERLHRFVDAVLRGVGIGDVGLDEDRVALAFERLHRVGRALLHHFGHHDLGALGEEPLGVREADALPGAGDDRDLVLEASHGFPYFFRRAMRLKRSVTTGAPFWGRPAPRRTRPSP